MASVHTARDRHASIGCPLPRPHRFSVDEYYALAAAGVIKEGARIELIEGELVDRVPIGSLHAAIVDHLARAFIKQTSDEITVRVQNPVRLDNLSEPEPDLALLRPREKPYSEAHPGAEDVLLIIEIADSSLEYDRDHKIPLYARHGIAEAWLFNLSEKRVTIYLEPSAEGYRKILHPGQDESIHPTHLPDVTVDVNKLFEQGSNRNK